MSGAPMEEITAKRAEVRHHHAAAVAQARADQQRRADGPVSPLRQQISHVNPRR